MSGRSLRAFLPRRLRARVRRPDEMRMRNPQYGQLVLDGEPLSGGLEIEADSLVWSTDGGRLAAQELVSWPDAPITRESWFSTLSSGPESPPLLQDGALRTQSASSRGLWSTAVGMSGQAIRRFG